MTAPSPPLTRSSELALDWAAHFASMRSGSAIDSVDLLLGLAFSHPDGEVRQLLDHFRIPGTMFADQIATRTPAYPFGPRTDLPARPRPRDDRTPLGDDVIRVLDLGASLAKQGKADDGLTRAKDLFGALLGMPDTPAWSALASLLDARGYPDGLSMLAKQYQQFLMARSSESYAEFLTRESPFSLRPLALPPYDADAVAGGGRGRDGAVDDGRRTSDQPDLVGITPEVDALAHLLTAVDLQPPLAVGLFGDWGAGKTFFMRALQRRIYRITEAAAQPTEPPRPQRALRIFKSVAQIEFNAWHYVEGNLWASLVEHIFRNLQTREGDAETDLDERRRDLAAKVRSTDEARERLQSDIDALEARRAAAARDAQALEARRTEAVREAGAIGPITRQLLESPAARRSVRSSLERLGLGRQWSTVAELRAAATDARTVIDRGFGIGAQIRERPRTAVAVALLLVVGIPAVSALVLALNFSELTAAIASITAALAGVTAILTRATAWTRDRLRDLETVEGIVDDVERTDAAERRVREQELEAIDRELSLARERAEQLGRQADGLRASMAELTPGQILTQFIDHRAGSDDYRKHLGVPAIIRRDFEQLSANLQRANASFIDTDDGKAAPEKTLINRIILYIDDLDRCPPSVVVQVLQAVHLLLAFPLFVVVVAVDSRWLANSLQQHYRHLIGRRPGSADGRDAAAAQATDALDLDGQATPDDYLEKIFQIPLWIRRLDGDARRQIVDGLVAPTLVTAAGDQGDGRREDAGTQAILDEVTRRALARRLFGPEGGESLLDPETLGILRHELEFMDALAPILGDSPRAVKRFVNVYRLVKALEEPRRPNFVDARPFADHKEVMFLLAVVTGLSGISARLWTGITQPPTRITTLGQLAKRIQDASSPGEERQQAEALVKWLNSGEIMGDRWDRRRLRDLAAWQPSIARFTFGSEIAHRPLPVVP